MRPFDYHRPATVADACALLASRPEAKLIAGGQSFLPTLRLRLAAPSDLVDLSQIADLRGVTADSQTLRIGAMMRHAEIAEALDVRQAIPALATLAGGIGDRQVRNRGTLGGSIANNDPAACYAAAALALGASIRTSKRQIAIGDYLRGLYETCLESDEIVTAVSFPIPRRAAYCKFRQPASRFALVGVFVAQFANEVRVAVTGAGMSGVFRVSEFEAALQQSFTTSALQAIKVDEANLASDLHASAAYRAHLIKVLTRRGVDQCLEK